MSAEFAPGIPSKGTSHELPTTDGPRVWEFGVHRHDAERRGLHFDLRLGDPKTGHAHSWAMHPEWPPPGKSTWAIAQPTHTVGYMDFEGKIEQGYGKGSVALHDREKAEVTNSKPGHISFNVYRGSGPEEYTLHRVTGKNWVLYNRTLSREKDKLDLPTDKPKYKEKSFGALPVDDPRYVLSAKIDDAHNLFVLPTDRGRIRVVSYRPGIRSPGGIIEHTHKIPGLREGVQTPTGLGNTLLRGGLYALHPETGEATPASTLAGLLNSDVWKSREKQKEHGHLRSVLYDVVRYRGKDMASAPYGEKLEVLKKVVKELPGHFELPRMAYSSKEKKELIADIKRGDIPETKEGVVAWNLQEHEAPIKAKFTREHDVHIKDFFPGEGKYKGNGVGGFYFSHKAGGPIVGRVGTGLSDELRKDMHKNPERYKGLVARVKSQGKFESGALRAPSFQDWHPDKNADRLDSVKLASVAFELSFLWGEV